MAHVAGDIFSSEKTRVLSKADLSRKGSVDAAIAPLVHYLNSLDAFYTTSSCSGRISVFCEDDKIRKKECKWLLVSHDSISCSQLVSALSEDVSSSGYTFFKFEPFILHLMCQTMEYAQQTLQIAVGAGFRNSGISFGKKGKIMLPTIQAIRSTHSLEVPVSFNGSLLVSKEYLQHLVDLANSKLQENIQRVERFFSKLKEHNDSVQHPTHVHDKRKRISTKQSPNDLNSGTQKTLLQTRDCDFHDIVAIDTDYSDDDLSHLFT